MPAKTESIIRRLRNWANGAMREHDVAGDVRRMLDELDTARARAVKLEVEAKQLRAHLTWAADRLQSAGLTVDAHVLRGIVTDSAEEETS